MTTRLFETYQTVLCDPAPPTARDPRLLMESSGNLSVFYAPFEHINHQARIALVGITPGPTQMSNANLQARKTLLAGSAATQAIQSAKEVGAFSGEPMRGNLIKQLNHWGIHQWLGLEDASQLFSTSRHLVHTTSLLRYPVFNAGNDYRGTPDMTRHPLLRKYLFDHFVVEVQALEDALFIGLGPQVQKVLASLVQARMLPANRVIGGMLHPSGNCTYRINYLIGDRQAAIPHATDPEPYDQGRSAFRQRFLSAHGQAT